MWSMMNLLETSLRVPLIIRPAASDARFHKVSTPASSGVFETPTLAIMRHRYRLCGMAEGTKLTNRFVCIGGLHGRRLGECPLPRSTPTRLSWWISTPPWHRSETLLLPRPGTSSKGTTLYLACSRAVRIPRASSRASAHTAPSVHRGPIGRFCPLSSCNLLHHLQFEHVCFSTCKSVTIPSCHVSVDSHGHTLQGLLSQRVRRLGRSHGV